MIVTRPGDGTGDGGIFMEPAASAEHSPARVAPVITSFLDGDKPEPAAT